MEKRKSDLPCSVVRDLLPLYHDEVVSAETAEIVAEHIGQCEACAKEYKEISREIPQESKGVRGEQFVSAIQRIRKNAVLKGGAIVATIVAVCIGIWVFLTSVPIVPMEEGDYEVSHVYRYDYDRENGDGLFYIIKFYYLNDILFDTEMSEDGKTMTLILRRPILCKREETPLANAFLDDLGESTLVKVNENVIWKSSDGISKNIPEYVDEWNRMEYDDSGKYSEAAFYIDNNEIHIEYDDGTLKRWTYDGELFYDGKNYLEDE